MNTAKEEVLEILNQIPDDVSFEDIQYHIYVRSKIEKGLQNIKNDRLIDQEEIEQRMSKWIDN